MIRRVLVINCVHVCSHLWVQNMCSLVCAKMGTVKLPMKPSGLMTRPHKQIFSTKMFSIESRLLLVSKDTCRLHCSNEGDTC